MRFDCGHMTVECGTGRGYPHLWVPQRVPECPQRACRRARKCVRPEMVAGRPEPNWPSCPLISNEVWAVWSQGVLRLGLTLLKEEAQAKRPRRTPRRRR